MGRCFLVVVPGVVTALAVLICQTGLRIQHLDRPADLGASDLGRSIVIGEHIAPKNYTWKASKAKKPASGQIEIRRVATQPRANNMKLLPLYSELKFGDRRLERDKNGEKAATVKLLPYRPSPADRKGNILIKGR